MDENGTKTREAGGSGESPAARPGPGTGFVLVSDHDPKPLKYQFEALHAGEFSWDYLESGPEVWRVRIARP